MEASSENQASPVEVETLSITEDDERSKKISVDSGITTEDNVKAEADSSDEVDGYNTSREMLLMQSYFYKLRLAMEPEITELCMKLYSEHKIGFETNSIVIDSNDKSASTKCGLVLKDIERRVMINPEFLAKILAFFEEETSDPLKSLATEMKAKLSDPLPQHSLSENAAFRPRQRPFCLKTTASSPAAFIPQLSTMCEHCEFQHQGLLVMFEKFCQDYLKADLGLTDKENESMANHSKTQKTECDYNGPQQRSTSEHSTLTHSQPDSLTAIPPLSLESVNSSVSGPSSLDPSLFESSSSISRQCSYTSCGGEEYITRISTEFIEKLKAYHQQEKQKKTRIVREKKAIKEKLDRTEDEIMELSILRSESDKELEETKERIAILEESLEDAHARIFQLNFEVILSQKQLMTEKCTNGNSVECKHFMRASTLEEENTTLKRQKERLEEENNTYRLKIEDLELRNELLVKMLADQS